MQAIPRHNLIHAANEAVMCDEDHEGLAVFMQAVSDVTGVDVDILYDVASSATTLLEVCELIDRYLTGRSLH